MHLHKILLGKRGPFARSTFASVRQCSPRQSCRRKHHPVDWKTGKGYLKDYLEHRFPLISGQDVSGVVDAVGAHVHDFKEGDEAVEAGAGDVVLVVGAAGGVGSFAVQMAAARGAHVIGVARTVNHDYVRKLGAADVVLDAIIDLASDGATVRKLSSLLRDGGSIASPVGTAPMDDLESRAPLWSPSSTANGSNNSGPGWLMAV